MSDSNPHPMQNKLRAILNGVLSPVLALLPALIISSLILLLTGFNPINAFTTLMRGSFGNLRVISEVLLQATPLILIGSGLAVAFRANIWNIGAEGQFYAGAVLATIIGIYLGDWPAIFLVPLLLLMGFIGGALWGMLAGYFKAYFDTSEIVITIMLNYIAIIMTGYLVTGPMIEEVGKFPQTAQLSEAARLFRFLPPTRLHIGFLIAIIVAILTYVLLFKTSAGYAFRAIGHNPEASRYAGINVKHNILSVMGISGGMAGLAGAIQVAGLTFRLFQQISPGYGFTGIAVTLLANNNPIGVIFSGLLFGMLRSGSEVMQISAKIPSVMVFIIQGLIVLSVITFSVYRAKRISRRES